MKIIYLLAIAGVALAASMTGASADSTGGTTRPSYDNPRNFDRDAAGNETYRYQAVPGQHVKKRHRHYDYDD